MARWQWSVGKKTFQGNCMGMHGGSGRKYMSKFEDPPGKSILPGTFLQFLEPLKLFPAFD